jgi:putative ABC transport system substrate-binding protein
MKRLAALAAALSLLALAGCIQRGALPVRDRPAHPVTIGIAFWKAEVAEYADAVAGFKVEMEARGYQPGRDLHYMERDAAGDEQKLRASLREMDGKADLIVTTGTRCTDTAKKVVKHTPVVFTAVFDPVVTGIVDSWHRPGGSFTGNSCRVPLADQMKVLRRILPGVKRVGIVFNPKEPNSRAQVEEAKALERSVGITVVESPLRADEQNLGPATLRLESRADVVLAPQDTVVSVDPGAIVAAADRLGLPVEGALAEVARAGGLMALAPNFYADGKRAAVTADLVLRGAQPAVLPVSQPERTTLVLNLRAAERLGIRVPQQMVSLADEVIR